MTRFIWRLLALAAVSSLAYAVYQPAQACCPARPPFNKPVVNADQTVIMIWDAATKTQHFIRQASFKSDADDFGFLVPTPTQPELEESGKEAFGYFAKLSAPEIKNVPRPPGGAGCGCSTAGIVGKTDIMLDKVQVLDEKLVAGFHAKVLQADSTDALVAWLKDNGYAYSPAVAAWAKPYVDLGWKFTALKVAKSKDAADTKTVAASALRITFKTDRPLFPYREPESAESAQKLGANRRMLRIYFVGESRYQGELTKDNPWTGQVAWAGKLSGDQRQQALNLLKLPENTGPADWWLTEFEDSWPYKSAPADVYFATSADQKAVKRDPIIQYVSGRLPADASFYAFCTLFGVQALVRWKGRRQGRGIQ